MPALVGLSWPGGVTCPGCKTRKKVAGRTLCRACLAAATAASIARRKRLISEGLCWRCGRVPAIPGSSMCEDCRKKDTARGVRWRKELRERAIAARGGRCQLCGHHVPAGLVWHHRRWDGKLDRKTRSKDRMMLDVIAGRDRKLVLICGTHHQEVHAAGVVVPAYHPDRLPRRRRMAALSILIEAQRARKPRRRKRNGNTR